MADPYLGEIRIFAFPFAPQGWALCNGALLSIQQNAALYSLLGVAYGGDGRTNFNLPDLRGRTPVELGSVSGRPAYKLGQKGGSETVQLTTQTMPPHNHSIQAANNVPTAQVAAAPAGNLPATVHLADGTIPPLGHQLFGMSNNLVALHPSSIANGGGGQGHNNMQPFSVVNFCIAMTGTYPPRD